MTPEAIREPEPSKPGMSAFSRILGVFFEPGKTFEDIGRRPTWVIAWLVTALAMLAFYVAYGQHVGFEQFVRFQASMNPRMAERMASMTPEQLAMQAKFTGIGYYATPFIFVPIVVAISAGILLGITAIMSAGLRYKQVFAIVWFAGMPSVLKHLLSLVVLFLKKPEDFNLVNPLAFNIAAFMDPVSSSRFWYTIASALDVFAIWAIILTGIGLSAAAGRKKLSVGGGIFAAATPFVVFVLFGASMAAIFS